MSCGNINTDIQRFVANMQTVDTIVNGDPLTTVTPSGKTVDTLAGYDKQFNDALDLIGWTIVDSFETGATITTRNEAVRYVATGELYRWDGTLPKTIPAGSTPATSGGLGVGKWLLVVNSAGGSGNGIVYDPPPSTLIEGVTYFNAETFELAFSYDDGDTTQYVTFPLAKPLGGGGSGDGEANTASNLGGGTGLFAAKVDFDLQFKSLVAGTGISLSNTATTVTITSTGEANTASNLGTGSFLFAAKSGTDLQFKSLVAGTGVTLTSNSTSVTINAPGTGEANTASNLGAGTAIFASKVGVDLQFKTLVAGSGVTISNTGTTVTISSTGGGGGGTTDHAALINRDANDQHPISAITGLQTALDGKASTDVATTSVSGLMSAADKVKLNGIAAGATVNSSDATLLNRANHTGSQDISTVTGLQTALDNKQPLDGDLTAIAALSTNGVPRRTAANTWSMLTDVKEIVVSTTAPTDTTKLWLDIN